ncbi:AAA family ATPase [Glaesserella parasuis]|uniref:AAA family ATPase n=1 Tax=Glaesserella parasuis TaxID=738 RepID=UPI0024372C83|nr:AAA family ATPase [Glaesserella parasuis]MDG6308830.1 AAA family ATPase [Glaesserella parasuis]
MDRKVRLHIRNFRAIKDADIEINGMTVISGINGSGKSTISKSLFYSFDLANNFHSILKDYFYTDLQRLKDAILYLSDSIFLDDKRSSISRQEIIIYSQWADYQQSFNGLNEIIDKLKKEYENFDGSNILNNVKTYLSGGSKDDDSSDVFISLKNVLNNIYQKYIKDLNNRPIKYAVSHFERLFNSRITGDIDVFENDNKIISLSNEKIFSSLFFRNVIYIDSPLALQSYNRSNYHWDLLNKLLLKEDSTLLDKSSQLSHLVSQEILQADIHWEPHLGRKKLVYQRELDNLVLDLEDCATGIKSLGIIQALIKNNSINEQTILILDEPEVHLHPQWIVEYARILVIIQKYIGCHILISSYSPDMIQAILYISEKEGLSSKLNFYLAKEIDDSKIFSYKHLGRNIEDIFECFNISLSKIEKYSDTEYSDEIL